MGSDVIIFEVGHYNGMGNYKTDQFVPVDSWETGDYLLDKTIELEYSDKKKYLVEKEENLHYALIKYNPDNTDDRYWNCMLRVHNLKVKSKEDIDAAIEKIKNKNQSKENTLCW